MRFLSGLHVSLGEGKRQSWVTITRTGRFTDPRYGQFEISREMLLAMVDNFRKGVYGQKIFIDLNHRPDQGAAGEIKDLAVEGNRLRALVEWTPLGIEAIERRRMIYLSAEYIENYTDNEEGKTHGPVLLGAALTVRPVIKRLDPVQLSEVDGDAPVLIHPELLKNLSEEAQKTMNKFLTKLLAELEKLGLPESARSALGDAFAKALGESTDESLAASMVEAFAEAGKQLADELKANPGATIKLSVPAGGVSAEDVKRILAEHELERAKEARRLAEARASNLKVFKDLIQAAEGLDDETKRQLCDDGAALITHATEEKQIKALADMLVKQARQISVARQLGAMGYPVGGSPRVTPGEDTTVKALQETIDKRIGIERKDVHPFVAKVLGEFDRIHARRLAEERKLLAGEQTGIADTNLPVGYQRTVIREALSDLNILAIVNAIADFQATATVNIPYETRDTSQVRNDGIVYEGQEIHGASIRQDMDLAYVTPMKLALRVSNEVAFFSRNNPAIDWDAYARNVQSNARVIRELLARRVANELQRAADAYGAVLRANDNLTAQLDGATSQVKTTYFPVVRPHQVRDLRGNAVGAPEHPITVTLAGQQLAEYDGTGTQPAGTYYRVVSHNLGYIQFVNETGAPVAPAAGTALTVSYYEATNVTKFDLDVPSGANLEDHLNGLLRAIGARKAILTGDRFVSPDKLFMLMSPTLNDTVTNARAFVESQARNGTALNGKGDLATVKGVPAFGTNAPAIDLGDERIIMGEAGVTGYAVVKPFTTGAPFEAVGPNGKPTGEKVAYGEEYNAIKTPTPLRQRLTSVLAFSASGR